MGILDCTRCCGAAAFVVCLCLGGLLSSASTCLDGYASQSIGLRGACSHHGGVNHSQGGWIFLLSGLVGIATWRLLARRNIRLAEASAYADHMAWKQEYLAGTPAVPAPPESRSEHAGRAATERAAKACPACGASMLSLISSAGPLSGTLHWRCERYPDCDGVEPISSAPALAIASHTKANRNRH
jgi:hypothetical protein